MGSLSISSCWLELPSALLVAGRAGITEAGGSSALLSWGGAPLIPSRPALRSSVRFTLSALREASSAPLLLVRQALSPISALISALLEPFPPDAVQPRRERTDPCTPGCPGFPAVVRPRADLLWQGAALSPGARGTTGPADELLVQRWQEGDRTAFEALVRRYQHVAYTVCLRYLRNPQSAEETAQDVFVALYRKLHEFRGESSFKSWFYRVLTNHCHNRHKAGVRRAEGRHSSLDAPLDPSDPDSGKLELPDASPDPEARLAEAQRQALIDASLADIGEEARLILLLREGQGMAYEDIGDALQLNAGTVKSRIHRARAELKAAVERRMAAAGFSRLG